MYSYVSLKLKYMIVGIFICIVLLWIKSHKPLPVFVHNRLKEKLLQRLNFRYVTTTLKSVDFSPQSSSTINYGVMDQLGSVTFPPRSTTPLKITDGQTVCWFTDYVLDLTQTETDCKKENSGK